MAESFVETLLVVNDTAGPVHAVLSAFVSHDLLFLLVDGIALSALDKYGEQRVCRDQRNSTGELNRNPEVPSNNGGLVVA